MGLPDVPGAQHEFPVGVRKMVVMQYLKVLFSLRLFGLPKFYLLESLLCLFALLLGCSNHHLRQVCQGTNFIRTFLGFLLLQGQYVLSTS